MTAQKNQLSLVFKNSNFAEQMEKYGIPKQHALKCTNQSNPQYCARWLSGADMNSSTLSKLCSHLHLNLLSFFTYYGHEFATELENLYRLEKAGLSVADILAEHGISPYSPDTLHHTFGEQGEDRSSVDQAIEKAMAKYQQSANVSAMTAREVMDKLEKIQKENKAETSKLYKQIGQLEAQLEAEKEKNRQLRSEIGYHSTLRVADDSRIGEHD